MENNLNKLKGLVFSQRVLLELTQNGVSRENAYKYVQRNAMQVWEQGKDFQQLLINDADIIAAVDKERIIELFDLDYHTKNIDKIFNRIFS